MYQDEKDMDEARPWDLLDTNKYTTDEIRGVRYKICLDCERLISLTRTCKECGCFMSLKTWLKHAECPLGKWRQVGH